MGRGFNIVGVQLIQLFERAYDELHPVDNVWSRRDGKYVDPFRPVIEPTGFATEKQVELSRETHLSAVRKMFEELDVFIFTLGLTETWKSNIDGAVFPVAPKVVTDSIEISQYIFINFSSLDVKNDLLKFMQMLNKKNPTARMILTVSPVPLVRTYEDRSVVTSTCYSKSALRVAAEEVCQSEPNIAYFPSYEIICGHFSRGSYFGSDLRNVTQRGVDHVMRLFLAHYGNNKLTVPEISRDWETIFDVVCDEEQAQPLIGLQHPAFSPDDDTPPLMSMT